jgi:hypothetical protein
MESSPAPPKIRATGQQEVLRRRTRAVCEGLEMRLGGGCWVSAMAVNEDLQLEWNSPGAPALNRSNQDAAYPGNSPWKAAAAVEVTSVGEGDGDEGEQGACATGKWGPGRDLGQ